MLGWFVSVMMISCFCIFTKMVSIFQKRSSHERTSDVVITISAGKEGTIFIWQIGDWIKITESPISDISKKKLKYLELNHESEWSWVLCWCSAAWAAAEPKQKGSKMGYALDALDQSNCDPSVCESTKVRLNFLFNYLDQQMLIFRNLNIPDTAQKTVSESFWLIGLILAKNLGLSGEQRT